MIIVRAPLRWTVAGGGTDLPSYAFRFGGDVLTAAMDKYVYAIVNRPVIDDLIRVNWGIQKEVVPAVDELKNKLVRASLQFIGITKQVEVSFMGDVPDGTGLGSSSAYTVALLQALHFLKYRFTLLPKGLAEAACHVEIEMLGRPIGKQDQYIAAFGGLRRLRIATDGSVKVEKPNISRKTLEDLKSNLLLFFTGERHDSVSILGEQKRLMESGDDQGSTISYYHQIKAIGEQIREALERGDLTGFGKLLHWHWMVKQNLPGGVSNQRFTKLYEKAIGLGVLGGKILGAGGGGFFLFFCEPGLQKSLCDTMEQEGLRKIKFDYDWRGAVLLPNFSGVVGEKISFPKIS